MAPGPDAARPEWFSEFLADRGTRKPSAHTLAAYCRDFDGIAEIITGGDDVAGLALADLNRDSLRTAFAVFAESHAAASIRRAWSTWNTLCNYLFSAELIAANPMPMVARPKSSRTLPKSLSPSAIDAVLSVLGEEADTARRDDWAARDRAIVLTALLAGLRLDELVALNVGDIRRTESGAVLHVRGKGNKDRRVPIETPLIAVIEDYLASRAIRFPRRTRSAAPAGALEGWPATAPLFADARTGSRITRNTLQYRVLRAFRRAGVDAERQRGALVHGLRHTFATDLANADVNVYELKNLLGHESLVTSQRYIEGAGRQTREAAARNPLYDRLSRD